MLVKFIQSKKSAWNSFLDTCVFAYNTSRHESTRFTPFELMFGRQATLPIDIDLRKALPEEAVSTFVDLNEPDMDKLAEERVKQLEEAKRNILEAQRKQKEVYDKKHAKPDQYKIGQLVLKKDFTHRKRKGGKLEARFPGPYTFTKVLPNGTFELENPDKKGTICATGAHLKLYNSADPPQLPGDSPSLQPPEDNLPTDDDLPPIEDDLDDSIESIPPLPPPLPSTLEKLSKQLVNSKNPDPPKDSQSPKNPDPPKDSQPPKNPDPPSRKRPRNELAKQMMFKRRQNRVKPHSNHVKKPIDVESYKPKRSKIEKRWWIPELGLVQSDRDILLSPTEWLSDNIVNASQKLLKKANPRVSGLQDVACGLTMNFVVEPDEFVQIIHTGHGHWNTISTIGMKHGEVQVFDSMYMCLPTMAKAQIATLLATEQPAIKVNYMDVHMQSGGYDCGLFAIAFATALVYGNQPGHFIFHQEKTRAHLIQCLQQQEMSLFPVKKMRRSSRVKSDDEIRIYCVCRMPELTNTTWIQCSSCKEWYHSDTCVQVATKFMDS